MASASTVKHRPVTTQLDGFSGIAAKREPQLSCNHTECPLPSSHHGPLNDKPCKAQRTHTG